jgi:hypothetical protein
MFLSFNISVFSFNWMLYSPAGIHANNILFGAGSNGYTVICTNDGIWVDDGDFYLWNNYTNSLPVLEAIPYDANNILLVMGDGSYSDGIYKFNLSTTSFEVVEFCYIPIFIRYCTANSTYYVGTRYDGMLSSTDGITWLQVPYFEDKAAAAMDFYDEHIVVIQENNVYGTYYSDDGGISWNQSLSDVSLHDIAFDQNGIIYGVFNGISNSSGLYVSNDFGHTWDIEYFTDNINTIGFDVTKALLTGFHGAFAPTEGVAIYDPIANDFAFLNAGLDNKNINKFKVNPVMSSIAIFVCTDNGVYFSNDYYTAVEKNEFSLPESKAYMEDNFPEPFINNTLINYYLPENTNGKIVVNDMFGRVIAEYELVIGENTLEIENQDWAPGVYSYGMLVNGKAIEYKKMIITQ